MLDLHTGSASDCSGLSRRSFLRVGGLAPFGLTLPAYLQAMAEQPGAARAPAKKAKRCILLWMQGGPSHHDSFDPKPDAPAEVRGEFGTIPTTLPGVRFCDPLPMLAKQTDKLFWLSDLQTINRDGLCSPVWLRPKGEQPVAIF